MANYSCRKRLIYRAVNLVLFLTCLVVSRSDALPLTEGVYSHYNVHQHTRVCMEKSRRYIYLNESGNGEIIVMKHAFTENDSDIYNLSCRFRIVAPRGLGVFAVIHNMTLRLYPQIGRCIDYVKFDSVMAWHVGPAAPPLCGYRGSNYPVTINRNEAFSQNTSNAIFDPSGKIDVEIHTDRKSSPQEIYLTLVIIPFIECGSWSTLSNYWQACPGLGGICISQKYFCDGFINCGAGTRTDESWCSKKKAVGKQDVSQGLSPSNFQPKKNKENKLLMMSPYTTAIICLAVLFISVLVFRVLCFSPRPNSRGSEQQENFGPPTHPSVLPEVPAVLTANGSVFNQDHLPPPPYDSLFPGPQLKSFNN